MESTREIVRLGELQGRYTDHLKPYWDVIQGSGQSKNFEKGGLQFISSVLIDRKCAQRNICLLHGKKESGFLKKNMSQWGAHHRFPI